MQFASSPPPHTLYEAPLADVSDDVILLTSEVVLLARQRTSFEIILYKQHVLSNFLRKKENVTKTSKCPVNQKCPNVFIRYVLKVYSQHYKIQYALYTFKTTLKQIMTELQLDAET